MDEERAKRKLRGIFSADAVGYSRLMRQDETATVATLKGHKEAMTLLIERYNGHVVDSPGDNILAEFASVVDAIECAVEIQNELKNMNETLPNDCKMEFRIGIHLGDVIWEEGRIYGDGVNIAARIEGLAEPGGICISRTTYDSVKDKLPFGYEYLGEQSVKNIAEPVRVYRVLMGPEVAGKVIGEKRFLGRIPRRAAVTAIIILIALAGGSTGWNFYLRHTQGVEPASLDKMAFPLPDKPSIAVLPFENLSGDSKQEYIGDGITENIITALSKISEMFVIARNSTFTYKGKSAKIQQVAEDLGVQYVLKGSLMRSGDQVRVSVQLIDTKSEHHLWAEQYDRKMTDLFNLIDEIASKIVLSLQIELTEGERAYVWHSATDNFEAWGYTVKGYNLFLHNAKEDNVRARELFERAIKLDPKYSTAWTYLAWTHWHDVWLGWSETPDESINKAIELANKAQNLDDTQAEVHSLLSSIYVDQKQYEKSIAEAKRGIAISPNNSLCHAYLAWAIYNAGMFDKAVEVMKRAMRLSPYYPIWYLSNLGEALTMAGHLKEAISVNQKLVERGQKEKNQSYEIAGHAWLAIGYSMLGREDEARPHVAEVLKVYPDWSLEFEREVYSYKNSADLERHLDALRKLGIPEQSPQQRSD